MATSAEIEIHVLRERIAQLEAAAKSGLTELLYLAEQVKAREGGSVRGAILALEVALNRTITKAMGSFHKRLAELEGIPASPATGAGVPDGPAWSDVAAPATLITAAKAVVSHWNEFGPECDFAESVDRLDRTIKKLLKSCPECDGKGWIQAGGPEFANLYQEKCEACDGKGVAC